MNGWNLQKGFTIVELLIVVVVIAILAAITIVSFNGIQARAANSATVTALNAVAKSLELYKADTGSYPSTGSLNTPLTDAGCLTNLATATANWVPGLTPAYLPVLPDASSAKNNNGGPVESRPGCYAYASDGTEFILSAWNLVEGGPQTSTMYRRIGFTEVIRTPDGWRCNHVNIGGSRTGTYVVSSDFYKHSFTVSNITSCNETPPSGA